MYLIRHKRLLEVSFLRGWMWSILAWPRASWVGPSRVHQRLRRVPTVKEEVKLHVLTWTALLWHNNDVSHCAKFLAVLELKLDCEKGGGAKSRCSLSLRLSFHSDERRGWCNIHVHLHNILYPRREFRALDCSAGSEGTVVRCVGD